MFKSIIEDIRKTLSIDIPEIAISYHVAKSSGKNRPTVQPKMEVEVPDIVINSEKAMLEIKDVIDKMIDYSYDVNNTIGAGNQIQVVAEVGSYCGEEIGYITQHSNQVTARWIFKREMDKLAKNAITLCDITAKKFDALVEYNSNAAIYIKNEAKKVADIYRRNSVIMQNPLDTTPIGEVFITEDSKEFHNAVHPQYSDFNIFELEFARELDSRNVLWMRNPANGFLKIPLLDGKGTDTFNPDFIVWTENEILALDTKGSHLIAEDSNRKLFYIEKACEGKELIIRLVSEKKYNERQEVIDTSGYTVWMVKQGTICPTTCSTLKDAVDICINS